MGYEYKILFQVPKNYDFDAFKSMLDNPVDKNGWKAFELEIEPSGFYFLAYIHSPNTAIAFHRIIDEALKYTQSIIIEEG